MNTNKELMYISRSSIPSSKFKKNKNNIFFKQVCIYGFNRNDLKKFSSTKTPLEKIEDIEILRFLENGKKVKMIQLSQKSYAVDTLDDIKKIEKLLKR